jgi:hypothetical protein
VVPFGRGANGQFHGFQGIVESLAKARAQLVAFVANDFKVFGAAVAAGVNTVMLCVRRLMMPPKLLPCPRAR